MEYKPPLIEVSPKPDLESKIVDSLVFEGIEGLSEGLLEAGIDAILGVGLLKEIPVVGSIIGLAKLGVGISNLLFANRVCRFLSCVRSVPVKARREFYDKLNEDIHKKRKVGETLIHLMDKCNENEKANIIGNLLSAMIVEKISYDDFLRLSHIVNRIYLADLCKLHEMQESKCSDDIGIHTLYLSGLLSDAGYDEGQWGSEEPSGIIYRINTYGELMLKYGISGLSQEYLDQVGTP